MNTFHGNFIFQAMTGWHFTIFVFFLLDYHLCVVIFKRYNIIKGDNSIDSLFSPISLTLISHAIGSMALDQSNTCMNDQESTEINWNVKCAHSLMPIKMWFSVVKYGLPLLFHILSDFWGPLGNKSPWIQHWKSVRNQQISTRY